MTRSTQETGAERAIRTGLLVLACGVMLLFLPLLIDLRSLNKYVVVLGIVALLVGLGCVTNGAIDALRARRR